MMIRLVAVSPGGEVYITCDPSGTWRRHERYLPGSAVEINMREAQRAIAVHDLTKVEEVFSSWPELDERARELVPLIDRLPPISNMLARSILPELQERVRLNGTPTDDIVRLIGTLLIDKRVAGDDDLRSSLAKLLSQRQQRVPHPRSISRLSRMRHYFDPLPVAA